MQDVSTQEILKEIDRIRQEKKISVKDYIKEVEISRSIYYDYQKGDSNPGCEILFRMIKYLKIDINPILYKESYKENCVQEPIPSGYKKICADCKEKDKQIAELYRTINSHNTCIEKLTGKKVSR